MLILILVVGKVLMKNVYKDIMNVELVETLT